MFDWLAQLYVKLIVNFRILLENPSHCFAVERLQLLALTLLALVGLKLALHLLICAALRRRFPPLGGEPLRLLRQLAPEVGLSRTPALYTFADCRPMAFTLGVFRPSIYLAPAFLSRLSSQELKAVLAHELIHVRRRDNLRLWIGEVLVALVPAWIVQLFALEFILDGFHSQLAVLSALPGFLLMKLMMRPLRAWRERCCDDSAVELIRDPLVLASSLLQAWRLSHQLPPFRWDLRLAPYQPFLAGRREMESRIRRLLQDPRRPLTPLASRWGRWLTTALLSFLLVFLVLFYRSDYARLAEGPLDCQKVVQLAQTLR